VCRTGTKRVPLPTLLKGSGVEIAALLLAFPFF